MNHRSSQVLIDNAVTGQVKKLARDGRGVVPLTRSDCGLSVGAGITSN